MGIQRQNICSSIKSCEMKLIVASLIGYLNAESLGRSRYARDADYEDALLEHFPTMDDPRKLKQLLAQLKHYNGGDFDESRIRGYGCNCFMNDFGMENVSYGKPVNQLDSSCRAYQECLKCAREEHGSHCFPDHTGYKMFFEGKDVTCGNANSTCRRSLCECDKMFATMQLSTRRDTTFSKAGSLWTSVFEVVKYLDLNQSVVAATATPLSSTIHWSNSAAPMARLLFTECAQKKKRSLKQHQSQQHQKPRLQLIRHQAFTERNKHFILKSLNMVLLPTSCTENHTTFMQK